MIKCLKNISSSDDKSTKLKIFSSNPLLLQEFFSKFYQMYIIMEEKNRDHKTGKKRAINYDHMYFLISHLTHALIFIKALL